MYLRSIFFLLGQKRLIRRASTAYRKLRQYAAVYTNAESQATLIFRNNRFIVGLLQISYGILLTAEVKKYRCLCVCAKTAFAISTPVSFLYSFSFFHLVAWKRQGAAFYGTALCWASSIDSARLNIVVTSCYGIRGNKKATALCFKA